MFHYYMSKHYFNAKHSFDSDVSKAHTHTFTVALYLGSDSSDDEKNIPFGKMNQIAKDYFGSFEGCYLNSCVEFASLIPNIENMGDCFYDVLKEKYKSIDMNLYQLDISENPLCIYQVSDQILLPTVNRKESTDVYELIQTRLDQYDV